MTTTQSRPVATTVSRSQRGLVVTGLSGALVAAVATAVVGALAKAAGVDFELPDGGEAVPVYGFAVVTFGFSVVGLLLAVGLRRWSRRPASTFVRIAATLTAVSLVPPFFQDANAGTCLSLVLLHLVAAAIVIPLIARRLPG